MDFYSWGLNVGRIAGIRIRLHWILILWWALRLDDLLGRSREDRLLVIGIWALGVVLMFGSILLHELGHCFAARSTGGWASDILLWPLGGLAFCECPDFWKSHFFTAVAGPLVSAAIAGVSYAALLGARALFGDALTASYLVDFLVAYSAGVLIKWNLMICIFNLLPIYPMDGGRIFHSLLWAYYSRGGGYAWGGYSLASRVTLHVSRVTAVLGIAYAVYFQRDLFLAGLFLWVLLQTESLRR